MNQSIRTLALKITPKEEHPENFFYALKMQAKTLLQMAHVPVRYPGTRRGIQRLTDVRRLREIARYIRQEQAVFPNSIIVNFTHDVKVTQVDSYPELYWLDIPLAPKTAVIIDGQHRLLGIGESELELEILVTAFIDIPESRQAAIFRDINFYQRKVNKSLMYDLFRVAKDAEYPLMRAGDLTERLNEEGPLQGLIKMTGVGPGVVTQTPFIETVQRFLQDGGVFREPEYDGEDSLEVQFRVVKDYFESLRGHYRQVWDDPRSYVLLKTQGIYASLMLLQDVLHYYLEHRGRHVPKARDFEPFTMVLAKTITFASEEYGDAYLGATGQRRLHRLLHEAIKSVLT